MITSSTARTGYSLHLKARLRPKTTDGYMSHLDTYLAWCQQRNPFERCTVLAYLGEVNGRCSRATLATYWKALKSFFAWCDDEGLAENPLAQMKPPRLSPDENERDAPAYTEADREALLAAWPHWTWLGLRNRALILTLWETPLRAAELCGLLVAALDWETLTVGVTGKAGVKYAPVMTVEQAAAIHRYLRERPYVSDLLWLSDQGEPMTPRALALMLKRAARRAGIAKPVYPHAFRHNFRARAAMAGMTDVELAAMMGHRTVRSGHRYGRRILEGQAWARYRQIAA